jgi:uncharacterized protein YutE (UPF0331/DUF86 family)
MRDRAKELEEATRILNPGLVVELEQLRNAIKDVNNFRAMVVHWMTMLDEEQIAQLMAEVADWKKDWARTRGEK